MARRVYFAFHYRDVASFRANVVRKSWITKPNREEAGFFDASSWEEAKKKGDLAIKRLINKNLRYTSVTAVLIGAETFSRRWVRYEMAKSFERGNGLLGVYIHKIRDKNHRTNTKGTNPFDYFYFRVNGNKGGILIWEWKGEWRLYPDVAYVPLSNVSYNFRGLKEGQLSKKFSVYDWVDDDGYNNFAKWVEIAAKRAGK